MITLEEFVEKIISKKAFILLLGLFFLNGPTFAQASGSGSKDNDIPSRQDEFYKMIEDMRARHREMMKGLLNDDQDFGSLFKQMEERLNAQGFGDVFSDRFNPIVGEYDWLEDENSRTLKLKVTQIKDKPLDIKIEKRMLSVKGNVESVQETPNGKSKSIVHFERSFSIPDDVDAENPSFENKGGEFHVRFPKLKNALLKKVPSPKPTKPNLPSADEERIPLTPEATDVSI